MHRAVLPLPQKSLWHGVLIRQSHDFIFYLDAGVVNRCWKDAVGSVPCRVLKFSLSYHALMAVELASTGLNTGLPSFGGRKL
jgi:hypothetical protein